MTHLEPPRVDNRIQVAGLIVVSLVGTMLIGVILWATFTGRTLSGDRAEESARLQFQLTRADMCANTAVLAIPQHERTTDRVQAIVNDCLAQVELPMVRIAVPEEP